MNEIITELLKNIPDYKQFLTLEELDESTKKLAREHPDCVSMFELGKTAEGRSILALKIGNGSKNALFFGCPHPNEPIGTMMLEHFTKALAENKSLRDALDYTFYIVKAWDADGLVRNEGWLKGPYTLYNYSRNFFRPAANMQVDWTFPIDYKELHFHDIMPETQALKDLIDEIKPTFTYALHNSGFGGVYWYVTEDVPELYPKLREAVERQGIPLHLGEPESPAIPVLAPAVLLAEGIEVEYDYFERFGAKNISKIISSGTCSDSYSKQHYGTFTFLTEMPYFFDPRIADPSVTDTTRGAAVIEKINWTTESNKRIREVLSVSAEYIGKKNPYLMAVNDAIEDTGLESNRRMAEEDEEYKRLATQAEYFDNVWVSRFYRLLSYGMLIRAHEYELEREHSAAAETALLKGKAMAEVLHKQLSDELEQKLNYSVIPIRKLINIQLECGLKAAQIIHDR